jgi:hypothetical protein
VKFHYGRPTIAPYGILWGHDLLTPGLRWKIGEGRTVHIGSDMWDPGHSSFLPLCYTGPKYGVVANLITDEHQWDISLLQQYFSPLDVEKIVTATKFFSYC